MTFPFVADSINVAYFVSPEYSVLGGRPLSRHFMMAFPDRPPHTFPTALKLPRISRAFNKFCEYRFMVDNSRTESYPCQEPTIPVHPSIISPMTDKDEKQAFSDRFNAILDLAGVPPKGKGRQGVLSKMFHVSDKGARKWIEGEAIPSVTKNLPPIIEKFKDTGVTIEWLLTGNPAYTPEKIKSQSLTNRKQDSNAEWIGEFDTWDGATPLRNDEVELPFFREVELAAGSGRFEVIENHGLKLRFAKSTLKKQGVSAESAACVMVSGNSMDPVLPDGSAIGIDTSNTQVKDGDMYAIDHNGHLRVKLLYKMPSGGLRLHSYNNDEWPDEHYSEDVAKDIKILGRVFWYSVLR